MFANRPPGEILCLILRLKNFLKLSFNRPPLFQFTSIQLTEEYLEILNDKFHLTGLHLNSVMELANDSTYLTILNV